ncbi:hypothetical protein ACFWF3_14640, partial [Nocardia sp. NPDC060220]
MGRISMSRRSRTATLAVVLATTLALVPASGVGWADPPSGISNDVEEFLEVGRQAVPGAQCGAGSMPETGIQGDVPAEDRTSGRSRQGYRCNMSLIGGYAGRGGGITSVTFDHCSYTGSFFPGNLLGTDSGVQVLDISDPANPRPTAMLSEPAMLGGTWESLKVNV